MLSFDIETMGLDKHKDAITVAAVYGDGLDRTFNFMTNPECAEEFLTCLDNAESLCSFNGPRFDIPFIVAFFKVPSCRYEPWIKKLYDIFECCKLMHDSSCSLNTLLLANGHEPKISTGLQAVEWAKQKRWPELEEYCMADTKLTHIVSTQRTALVLPMTSAKHHVMGRCRDGTLALAPL